MITIRHKRSDCIGCALCAETAPHYWHIDDEGLARLNQPTEHRAPFDIAPGFEEDRDALQTAAEGCPVSIIQIH